MAPASAMVCQRFWRVDWARRLAPWTELSRQFKTDGFYERFPAKGQVERVARVHRELSRAANVERRGKAGGGDED